jgi:hypothetical protein
MAFLQPTLIGNTIGGVSLVAFLNHAPLSAERGVPSGGGSLTSPLTKWPCSEIGC